MLGAGHTAGKGGMAPGAVRMHAAVGMLLGNDVSVAGLQEFQEPQYRTFLGLAGGTYDAYPGLSLGAQPVQNSIIWKQADWSLVEAHTGTHSLPGRDPLVPAYPGMKGITR